MKSKATLDQFIKIKNEEKKLFTAGPASLAAENIVGLEPCFGRGDSSYEKLENRVLSRLKEISGHKHIARLQGSGSMGLEVMISNLAYGKVLVIDTGYYAKRAQMMAEVALKGFGQIKEVSIIDWRTFKDISGNYDWVIACYTETSIGLKLDIDSLRKMSDSLGAKLMLDATASIGLEDNHEQADAISYSSCKGLFGLTGAAFVAFNELPSIELSSFNLSIKNHMDKKMTGPYHAICSLSKILDNHDNFKSAVKISKEHFIKKFSEHLILPSSLQPMLCTRVRGTIVSNDRRAVLYSPRTLEPNESVVCHIGEIHLGTNATGEINECLSIT